MKVRIWGGRGSIPSPLKPADIREKIRYAILNLPDINTQDPKAVDAYLDSMSPLRAGTVGGRCDRDGRGGRLLCACDCEHVDRCVLDQIVANGRAPFIS